jgi:hypothetical protein
MATLAFAVAPWSFVDGDKPIEAMVSGPLIATNYTTLLGAARRCEAWDSSGRRAPGSRTSGTWSGAKVSFWRRADTAEFAGRPAPRSSGRRRRGRAH